LIMSTVVLQRISRPLHRILERCYNTGKCMNVTHVYKRLEV